MERACVCVFLVLCLVQSIFCQECELSFTQQPLSELTCRPTGQTMLALYCTTSDNFVNLDWFYTNDEDQAGINGTKISYPNSQGIFFDTNYNYQQPRLTFSITNRTIGFYWCKVTDERYSNVSVRSSAVAHIQSLDAYNNSSLNQSCIPFVNVVNSSIQCAIISGSSSSTVLSPTSSSEASIQDSVSITGTASRSSSISNIDTASWSSSISITSSMSSSFIYFALSTSPSFLVPSLSLSLLLSATTSSSSLSFTPTQSLEPSPTTTGDTENNVFILYALAGVCGLLAVIALVIVIAIFVLCYLTKHQSRRRSYTPKGQAGEDSSGVGGRRNSVDEKPSSQLPQQNTNNNINSSHHPPPPSQIQQRGLSFSNPVYDIAKVQSSDDANAFDVFPPRIVPPDQPKTNSLPKYAKPDLSKKKSHSDEEYVSPHNTLPSGSDGMYDQVAISPTGTSSTIGSRPPPPAEEPLELPPSLNLYDDPNQLSPILHSPPAAYEEPHLTSPNISSPPPLPPPPVESALYDDPHEVISPSQQRPDSYMQPLSLLDNINNGGEKESYYSIPADAMPHQYHELINMQESSQASTTTTTASTSAGNETSTAPDNSAAPQESAYDDPWGSMPTGIKRGSSRSSKSHGGRSHSITHSVSPNLFDDPQYDTPSPHQTTPIETNNY